MTSSSMIVKQSTRCLARTLAAAAAALAVLAAAPAGASASLVQVTEDKLLRIAGFDEERSLLEMRFSHDATPVNPFGRFIVVDNVIK